MLNYDESNKSTKSGIFEDNEDKREKKVLLIGVCILTVIGVILGESFTSSATAETQSIYDESSSVESASVVEESTITFITDVTKCADTVGYVQQELVEETTTEYKSTLLSPDELYGSFISYSCDESLNDDLKTYIDLVPQGVIYAIRNLGYHIELVENPGKDYGYLNVCGLTIPKEKIILIEANESKFRRCVVHELGHAYDDSLDWISTSNEFKEIYEEEKEKIEITGYFTDNHYKSNEKEYFSEAFQMYIFDASTLKSSAPKTFEYVKRYVGEVE